MSKKWYITTPIYYVTAKPHLGSLYSTLIADAIARWKRLSDNEVFFLTGSDEHGQKIAQAAHKAELSPKAFVDSFIDAYKDTWHAFHIEYSYFMRTTDVYHVKAVQTWLTQLLDQGDIYKGKYTGWYCTPCETFVLEDQHSGDNVAPSCHSCNRPTHYLAEETYFFKLSAYQSRLLDFYESNPDFIVPHARRNEVINFVKEGLKDLSISRTTVQWGIPFPGDEKHICYVWADALNNYLTAIGYADKRRSAEFHKWWPADTQVMGKDIIRFHAIYWPAFLMAAGLSMPKQLLVHGWIQVDKQKMSKSLGNAVDPMVLCNTYGADEVRYYLLRHMAITHDGEFSIEHLEETITSDLANNIGNLVQRITSLAHKYQVQEVIAPSIWGQAAMNLRDEYLSMIEDVQIYMDEYSLHMALSRIIKYVSAVNAYVHGQEPWKCAVSDKNRFNEIISAVCHSLQSIAILLWPVMPVKMQALLNAIGAEIKIDHNLIEQLALGRWHTTYRLKILETPLFKKFEIQSMNTNTQQSADNAMSAQKDITEIDITDFSKVILAVGTITTCQAVEGSDKLLKMSVDCGQYGIRQILSGVQKHFSPDQLVGKQGIFVINLKPRKMAGLESQGMMLLAECADGTLSLATVEHAVPAGMRLR
jgi:methionyl-tRNA synthetase